MDDISSFLENDDLSIDDLNDGASGEDHSNDESNTSSANAIIDGLTPNSLRTNYDSSESTLAFLLSHVAKTLEMQSNNALLVAIAEVVDELSNGKLKLIHKRIESERRILASNVVVKTLLSIQKSLKSFDEKNGHYVDPAYFLYIKITLEYSDFVCNKYKGVYKQICEELGIEPDSQLLEKGMYTTSTQYRRYGLEDPPAYSNENTFI